MIRIAVLGRTVAMAVVFTGVSFISASAQDVSDAHLAAARDAIAALNITDRYDNILPGLSERLKAQFIQASPNFQAQISDVVDGAALALAPRRADLEREAATIYAKSFSIDELKSIATFFGTDAGKKLLNDQPLVSRELVRAAEIWATGISRDLTNQSSEKLRGIIDATPIEAPVVEAAPVETIAPAAPAVRPAAPAARPAAPAPAARPAAPAATPAAPAARPAAPAATPAAPATPAPAARPAAPAAAPLPALRF